MAFLDVSLAADVVVRQTGDEAVLLKLEEEAIFTLNATGARVVALVGEGLSVPAIVERLTSEYDVSADDVSREVDHLIGVLVSKGLAQASRMRSDGDHE